MCSFYTKFSFKLTLNYLEKIILNNESESNSVSQKCSKAGKLIVLSMFHEIDVSHEMWSFVQEAVLDKWSWRDKSTKGPKWKMNPPHFALRFQLQIFKILSLLVFVIFTFRVPLCYLMGTRKLKTYTINWNSANYLTKIEYFCKKIKLHLSTFVFNW